MTDPWIPLLMNLPLSRTEREVVKRFEADPLGRTFLPVADILRAHRLVDESLELLTQGVERHGTFTVARVVLARELLQKGLVAEAWRTLEDSPVPLKDNLLAQKLRFRLATLLGDEGVVRATYQHLKLHQMVDAETKRLGDLVEISGLEPAREKLLKDLRDKGIEPVLPPPGFMTLPPPPRPGAHAVPPPPGSTRTPPPPPGAGQPSWGGAPGSIPPGLPTDEDLPTLAPVPSGAASPYFTTDGLDDDARLSGFHVVPLAEIFHPGDDPRAPTGRPGGVELDSTTLADIYARQGHYGKALEVYRRLLRMTPGNDLLRRKVAELARLEQEQKVTDLTVDPTLVDRMETVEIIDRQIRFYNDLLSKLT